MRLKAAMSLAGLLLLVGGAIGTYSLASEKEDGAAPPAKTESPQLIDVTIPEKSDTSVGHLDCTSINEAANFKTFSLGESFQGNKLEAIMRYCMAPPRGGTVKPNYVSYIYGTCETLAERTGGKQEGGCQPPIQIQSWAACERTLSDYQLDADTPYPHSRPQEIGHGAMLVEFDGGVRQEIYAGDSTIVIQAVTPEMATKAVDSLVEGNTGVSPRGGVTDSKPAVLEAPTASPKSSRKGCEVKS